jgi:tRNA pseudouridine38-40 synthase
MTSVRTISDISVVRSGDCVILEVEADGFLYNMVRAIAGTLAQVGRGNWPESSVGEALRALDRKAAGPTAPPEGLFMVRANYG